MRENTGLYSSRELIVYWDLETAGTLRDNYFSRTHEVYIVCETCVNQFALTSDKLGH